MKIGIIGGGAIGLLTAYYLHHDHDVTLYVNRTNQKEKIKHNELHFYEQSQLQAKANIRVKLIDDIQQEQCYIITVKQAGINNIIQRLSKQSSIVPLIFMQNGMGHLEKIQQLQHRVYIGIVEHGAVRLHDHAVNHLGQGQIRLATITGTIDELSMLQKALHNNAFPFKQQRNAQLLLKEKLIVNAVINPLTALFDIPNKDIIENEHIRFLAKQLCKETAIVLQLDEQQSWNNIVQIAHATGNNTSSMRADIQNGQQTEIEAITGYVLQQSKEEVPFTLFVYHAIRGVERGT